LPTIDPPPLPPSPHPTPPAEEQLQQLLRGVTDALLGWFVCRPVGQLAPSMREAAVTLSLQRWLQQRPAAQPAAAAAPRPPVLFAVLLSGQDHHGASTSLQYRLLQPAALEAGAGASPGGGGAGGAAAGSSSAAPPGHQAGPLVAVPLQTLNLGRSLGQHHAAPGGMTSAQHVDGSGLGAAMQQLPGPQAAGLEERLGAAAGAAGKQVADLAGACGALLARVSDLAGTLGPAEAEVAGLAAQRAQLLQQLHELRWQDAPGSTPSG